MVDLQQLAEALKACGLSGYFDHEERLWQGKVLLWSISEERNARLWNGQGENPELAFAMLDVLRQTYVFWLKSNDAWTRLTDSQNDFFWAVASLDRMEIDSFSTAWLANRLIIAHQAGLLKKTGEEA